LPAQMIHARLPALPATEDPGGPGRPAGPRKYIGAEKNHSVISPAEESLKCLAVCTVGELFGGVERHVLEMSGALRARGISTLLILFHNGELADRAREQGLEPLILPDRNLRLVATSRQLAEALDHLRIRIVHAHGYKAMVFCAMARLWRRFALVKTEHGLPEHAAGGAIGALRSRLYHLLDRAATGLSNTTACYVTAELATRNRGGRAARLARVIPNGVSTMDRHRLARPPEYRSEHFNLAVVGRLDPVKALHLAIEALSAQGVPQEAHLHVIGTGPCESELRAQATAVGVAARVHFLGFRRDAHNFIAHCDALLMPSLHEGLPYTLLEAMAFGTPVIASRVGGLAEIVQDGTTGLLVAPGDASDLADALRRLIADPSLRKRLGDAAQHVQRVKYTLEAMADSYIDVYRKVLAAAG
jgi:glycosyltransferase involved in cell wall biosynthesis